jgi:osmoprotectant transport system permease protein
MSWVTDTPQAAPEASGLADSSVAQRGGPFALLFRPRWRGASLLDLVATPLLMVAFLALLYFYVHARQLDSIEQRTLTRAVVTRDLVAHIKLVVVSSILVIALAVPLGVLLTRPSMRWLAPPFLALANLGQAVPSIGILVLLAVTAGIGFTMAVVALVLVSFLSVLRNTMVGIAAVDDKVIDAARGLGLSRWTVLASVELPLAVPVILTGIRVALILNVGSATLATFTNAGGLGDLILIGISLNRVPILLTGSVLTAVLALSIDWLAGLAERAFRPVGL